MAISFASFITRASCSLKSADSIQRSTHTHIGSFTPSRENMFEYFFRRFRCACSARVRVGINQEPFINLFKSHRRPWRAHKNTMENGNTIAAPTYTYAILFSLSLFSCVRMYVSLYCGHEKRKMPKSRKHKGMKTRSHSYCSSRQSKRKTKKIILDAFLWNCVYVLRFQRSI